MIMGEKEYLERLRVRAIRKNVKAKRLLKKVQKEISKDKTDISKVLKWVKKSTKLLQQSVELVEERNNIKNQTKNDEKSVNFVLEKVSERYVRKFGAKSCIFRAKLDDLSVRDKQIKVKDIMTELDGLFDDAIRQVRVKKALCDTKHLFNFYVNVPR